MTSSVTMTQNGDTVMVPAEQQEAFERQGWALVVEETSTRPKLAGKALDEALRATGLPLTGTADEKRERLALTLVPTAPVVLAAADPTEAEEATR